MNPGHAVEILRNFHLFESLPEEEFERLESIISCKKAYKYNALYETGRTSDEVYFLLKGTVKTCTLSDDGREVIKTIMHPVSMFGELGLVGEKSRHESAFTMNEDVLYCTISVPDFYRLMRINPALCFKFLHIVGKRLLKVEQKLEGLIFKDARARIIDFLKESAAKQGRKVGFEMFFKHCLTQQDIANLTGTSRQTVTSVMNDLRKENLIYFTRNTILIRDLGKLT